MASAFDYQKGAVRLDRGQDGGDPDGCDKLRHDGAQLDDGSNWLNAGRASAHRPGWSR